MSGARLLGSTQPKEPSSGWFTPGLGLHVVYPEELSARRIELRHGLVIGRVAGPGVEALEQPTVSARHASVNARGTGFWVSDLGSRNGTSVNGVAVGAEPAFLLPQMVVRFGDVFCVVEEISDRQFGGQTPLGTSAAVGRIRERLSAVAADPAPVLIRGQTGTGKERLAREVHRSSGRSGEYVAINCAELSPQLIESQLFGHERGAFTGAVGAHGGLFLAADRGTLFLDEIGELPLDLQPKLLRALQEGEIRPVGSVRSRRVDVRVVSATNRDLALLVEQGAFRRDLYARLAFSEFELPALRDCRQDILLWVSRLLEIWCAERGVPVCLAFMPDVVERVLLHDWADNLRGLNRMVHRLASTRPDRPIGVRVLGELMPELVAARPTPPEAPLGESAVRNLSHASMPSAETSESSAGSSPRPTREEFLAVYEANGHSVRATSKHFGRDRRQIYRWLESFGIERGGSD